MSTSPRDGEGNAGPQTYNPWTVVHVVFTHLADHGLQPTLGETGDPGPPAAALLLALGIQPAAEGDRQIKEQVRADLATLREAMLDDS